MIPELAVSPQIVLFSVKKVMDNSHLTIVQLQNQSKMNLSKTGLAHKELTNAQHKKMFFYLQQKMVHGLTKNSLGVKTNQLQPLTPKTGTANIMLVPPRKQDSFLSKLNNTDSMSQLP